MKNLLRIITAIFLVAGIAAIQAGCKKQDEDAARKKKEEQLDKKVEEKANQILNK